MYEHAIKFICPIFCCMLNYIRESDPLINLGQNMKISGGYENETKGRLLMNKMSPIIIEITIMFYEWQQQATKKPEENRGKRALPCKSSNQL